MYHETSLIKTSNSIAGKLSSKTRLRQAQKGCLKDKYNGIRSQCQILGGRRRSKVQGQPEGKKEYLIKRLDFPSAQNPAFVEWWNAQHCWLTKGCYYHFFSQKSNLCSVSFSRVDTANMDGLENCWDDGREKKEKSSDSIHITHLNYHS